MNEQSSLEHAKQVARLNDLHRRTQTFILTHGVIALNRLDEVTGYLRAFNHFTEDNDPYGEHDFGSFVLGGHKLFWKIDYYNQALSGWCDPLDEQCRRILTVLLAEEY